jgi:hypothetical protein
MRELCWFPRVRLNSSQSRLRRRDYVELAAPDQMLDGCSTIDTFVRLVDAKVGHHIKALCHSM